MEDSGVYVVELESWDALGRRQLVYADLYVAGDTPVAWKKPKNNVFEMGLGQRGIQSGETAGLLLKSPFQEARALVIVEHPRGNSYHQVQVEGGQGIFTMPVTGDMTRQIPVHAVLHRGRIGMDGDGEDRRKPVTMAATAYIEVTPRDHEMELTLTHPKTSLPGKSMDIEIEMKDPDGKPLDGQVTLWLVDRAVLSLGREARWDPVPSFTSGHPSRLRVRDTRNEVIGELPVEEVQGGGGSAKREENLLDKVTIRKNFKTVPYYNPNVIVSNGRAVVTIQLPDNLTDFAVRAVACDATARFGSAKSRISIRLPLIVQSALPRFVRPGDRFSAGGIGRVVEGEGGSGSVELALEGLTTEEETRRQVTWQVNQPQQVYFPLSVAREAAPPGETENKVRVTLAVSRHGDGASDAFQLDLPVKPDRQRISSELLVDLGCGGGRGLSRPRGGLPPRHPGTLRVAQR